MAKIAAEASPVALTSAVHKSNEMPTSSEPDAVSIGASSSIDSKIPQQMTPEITRDFGILWTAFSTETGIFGPPPRFRFDPAEGTAYWDRKSREVVVGETRLMNGFSWGEEIAHALYDRNHPDQTHKAAGWEQRAAKEFIGMLGRAFAQSIAPPEIKELYFSPRGFDSWIAQGQSEQEYRYQASLANDINRMEGVIDREFWTYVSLRRELREGLRGLRSTLLAWANEKSEPNQTCRAILSIWERTTAAIHAASVTLADNLEGYQRFNQAAELLNRRIESLADLFIDLTKETRSVQDTHKELPARLGAVEEGIRSLSGDGRSDSSEVRAAALRSDLDSHRWHFAGYIAAELFMERNREWHSGMAEIMIAPAQEIYDRYVNTPEVRAYFEALRRTYERAEPAA